MAATPVGRLFSFKRCCRFSKASDCMLSDRKSTCFLRAGEKNRFLALIFSTSRTSLVFSFLLNFSASFCKNSSRPSSVSYTFVFPKKFSSPSSANPSVWRGCSSFLHLMLSSKMRCCLSKISYKVVSRHVRPCRLSSHIS